MSDGVGSVNSSLYFSAVAAAAQETAKETTQKSSKKKLNSIGKTNAFSEILKKSRETEELLEAGFPKEIAEMQAEDAAVFLKDRMDEAGERLSEEVSADAFASYRLAVNQFVKYIVKNNFTIDTHKRFGRSKKTGKQREPFFEIKVVNQKLDMLATDMLSNHIDKLQMLAKVNELQGLIIDLFAA